MTQAAKTSRLVNIQKERKWVGIGSVRLGRGPKVSITGDRYDTGPQYSRRVQGHMNGIY